MSHNNLYLIVTMAGNSKRMGRPKQHVEIEGKTFLNHILDKTKKISFCKRIFIGQKDDKLGKNTVEKQNATWLVNDKVNLGPLYSIRIALSYIGFEANFMLWPIDFPLVSEKTLNALIETHIKNLESIIIPSYNLKRGHPVIFPQKLYKYFFKAPLNIGARWVTHKFENIICYHETTDSAVLKNINSLTNGKKEL